jgi:ribonuclease E
VAGIAETEAIEQAETVEAEDEPAAIEPVSAAVAPAVAGEVMQPAPTPAAAAIRVPTPPPASPAPMPIEELRPVLEQAGLTLVQTEPMKLADVLARFEREPRLIRVPRERPVLPPLDTGPLVQVETRGNRPAAR